MKIRVPAHIAALVPYVPGKPVEEVERELGLSGSVKVASNENPYGPSPKAVEAARAAMERANRYPDGGGFYLKRALSRKLSVPESRIVLGNGSTELVELLAKAFVEPKDESVVSEGAFLMYDLATRSVHGRTRAVPQTPDHRHDVRAMASAVGPRTRLLFVANPNNPTGTYITRGELAELLDTVPEPVLVVIDEAYFEYVTVPEYPDALTMLAAHPNLVVLRTFSKVYGLAGLRVGYAMLHEEVAGTLERVRSPFNTSAIAQAAALAALADDEHVRRSREGNLREMAFLEDGLRRLGLDPVPSVANFLLVPVGKGAPELYQALMARGVIARPMKAFGFPEALRISVGTRPENERTLEAMAAMAAGGAVPGAR